MEFVHKSVLLEESINWLITDKDGIYVKTPRGILPVNSYGICQSI